MAEPEPRSRPARVRRRVLICAPGRGRVVNGPAPRGLIPLIRPVPGPVDRLTAAVYRPRMPPSRAGSREASGLLMCPVGSGAPGRAVSENGRLCHGDGPPGMRHRRQTALMLTIPLYSQLVINADLSDAMDAGLPR